MLVRKHIKHNFLYIVIIVVNSCPALFVSVSIHQSNVHQFSTRPTHHPADIGALKCK